MAFRASDRTPSYEDAVRLLGQDEPKIIKMLDRLAGATVISASAGSLGALAFFDVRNELVKWGNDVVRTIRDRITGLSRFDRTQRLVAAHAVIVITSFYEALGEVLDGRGNSLRVTDLELTRAEMEVLVPGSISTRVDLDKRGTRFRHYQDMVSLLLQALIAIPEPHSPYEETLKRLMDRYTVASEQLKAFISRLACWESLSETDRSRMSQRLSSMPQSATRLYEVNYRRLAADVPEFAVWANLTDHRGTRATIERIGGELHTRLDGLTTGLAGIAELMQNMSGDVASERTRSDLMARYRRSIDVSILRGTDAPEGVVLPSLKSAYVNPRCRVSEAGGNARLADEKWWENVEPVYAVQQLIIGMLTGPKAVVVPLVVLGHPGAGKSLLTKMLAARLAGTDLLPIRVELRSVHADASIQAQIEHAIEDLTGRQIRWPDFVDAQDGALPVVMLDGLDELLQATGVNRSNYLEQVADFQRREYELDRPVAVIVTSRTVVAERARLEGCVVVKLEPFDETEVSTWLAVWNETNAATFAARGIQPLPVETALAHPELASQPLLLMMLALYDAGGNALQRAGADLSRAELYERLLADFARREVRKHHPRMDARDERREIETELRRLAVVALAMFNRHAQVVTEGELNKDFEILLPQPEGAARAGLEKPLDAAQRVVGRFFFIHESRALRDGAKEYAFEFLHATFGEFLVARFVVKTLRDLVEVRELNERHGTPSRLDDGFLWAALSFAALVGSAATVEFTSGLLQRLQEDERTAIKDLACRLLGKALYPQLARSFGDYEPSRRPVPGRHAVYSCNLAALAVLSADGPVDASNWNTGLWWSELLDNEWNGLRDVIRIFERPDSPVQRWARREDGSPVRPYKNKFWDFWMPGRKDGREHFSSLAVPAQSAAGTNLRTAAFFRNAMAAPMGLALLLVPCYRYVGAVTDRELSALVHVLLELRLAPFELHGPELRMQLYSWCLNLFGAYASPSSPRSNARGILLRQLREDARLFDPSDVLSLVVDIGPYRQDELSDVLAIVKIIEDALPSPLQLEMARVDQSAGPLYVIVPRAVR